MSATIEELDLQLADDVAQFYADPLGFVLYAFPWGEDGPLKDFTGPDQWQMEFLQDLGREVRERAFDGVHPVDPIKMSVGSGRGIGKSALSAMLVCWVMSTRPDSRVTVTANTFAQLETRTWAEAQTWMKMCITAHWFDVNASIIYRKGRRESWFATPQTCREENSQAFAGQQAARSSSVYIFDESSTIPNIIAEVAESGLTTGEPMLFYFGNVTRRTGFFYDSLFGRDKDKFINRSIDSRSCRFPNKKKNDEAIREHGEDSDYCRMWILGLAPMADDSQYIDHQRVMDAQKRPHEFLMDDPLICGVDAARGGADKNVIRFRRGFDSRSIPAIKIPGEKTRDSMVLVAKLADVLGHTYNQRKVDMMFVDSAIGGAVVNRLHELGYKNVMEVNFGSESPDPHFLNMRAFMYGKTKDWLLHGAIDKDSHLEEDLITPGIHRDKRNRIVLESKEDMKERLGRSPDDGDALALTFAMPVAPKREQERVRRPRVGAWS